MCIGPEQLNSETSSLSSNSDSESLSKAMANPTETVDFLALLELAANNDVEGFKRCICGDGDDDDDDDDDSGVSEIGLWYGRNWVSKKMVVEHRTPLMVAAKYGSLDVVKLILSLSEADVNFACSPDKSTALHCAVSGGSDYAIDVVKLLLLAGADPNVTDANGHRPIDIIFAPSEMKVSLEELLKNNGSVCPQEVLTVGLRSSWPSLLSSPDNGKTNDIHVSSAPERKEYPVDPSLPDIKNSIYATDEFRMFSFKIRPCSRAYSHDWTECPFVHPGENARRRDPRKFHYSCMPCPEFRRGACKRGDLCDYAHGVFESWLHPAQYRTRLCKDGTSCARRVCFFAHTLEELRPLYVSSGSGVPSPRPTTMDMAAALNMFPASPFTPPMSPSANGITHSSMGWPQQNIPTLNLPGSNLQTSRLRSSLNARDIPAEELHILQDFELEQRQRNLNDLSCLSQPHFGANSSNFSARSKTLTPSNLDEHFSAEVSSPRYSDQRAAPSVFSPSHKTALLNQLQQQQSMLSPINTNVFSPKNVDHPLLQASFGISSPGRMSPRGMEPISPMSSRLATRAHHEKQQQQQQLRSLSSRELGSNLPHDLGSNGAVGSPVISWSKWESHNGNVDWSVQADELGMLRKSYSIGHNVEEPDVSWVQSLVKESPSTVKETATIPASTVALSVEGSNSIPQSESSEHANLGAWLEQLQLDQIVA